MTIHRSNRFAVCVVNLIDDTVVTNPYSHRITANEFLRANWTRFFF
jgi:hypothetical protein